MSNNNRKPDTGKQKPTERVSKKTRMLVSLANWISQFNMVDSIANQAELLASLKESYLLSDYANDRDERDLMLNLFNYLEELLKIMDSFNSEDYRKLDQWLLEMNIQIQKEIENELS